MICGGFSPFHTASSMASYEGAPAAPVPTGVKDVHAETFINAYAAFLKKSGKVTVRGVCGSLCQLQLGWGSAGLQGLQLETCAGCCCWLIFRTLTEPAPCSRAHRSPSGLSTPRLVVR